MAVIPDHSFWRGKSVLLTGHTGFKGAWLALWLRQMGAEVFGLALPPTTDLSLHFLLQQQQSNTGALIDLRHQAQAIEAMRSSRAAIHFHLAAQAFVRQGYADPLATFDINVGGTTTFLEALRGVEFARVAVVITTDKVYRNLENGAPFVETDELGGHDPYSSSKAAAELVTASYRDSFLAGQGVAVATARAGNVIGGGDWSPDRLIPDCVRSWAHGQTVDIRMPGAIRPWQHVLDPLAGYLVLAQQLWQRPALAGAYNFGPDADGSCTVQEAVTLAAAKWGEGGSVTFAAAHTGPKEAETLRLSNAKAHEHLDFAPRWALGEAIGRTMAWYRKFYDGAPARQLCLDDIAAYERHAI